MTTTFDGIRALIMRDFELPPERLQRGTPLEEIELDSLALTELVFSIEDEFHVTADNSIPPFKTLGDISDYIDGLIATRAAAPAAPPKPAVAKAAQPKRARAPGSGKTVAKPRAAAKTKPSAPRAPAVGASRKPKRTGGARAR
jgi:acyl carrier protein